MADVDPDDGPLVKPPAELTTAALYVHIFECVYTLGVAFSNVTIIAVDFDEAENVLQVSDVCDIHNDAMQSV